VSDLARISAAVSLTLFTLGAVFASAVGDVEELHESIVFETTSCMWDQSLDNSPRRQFSFSLLPQVDLSDFASNAEIESHGAPYPSWMLEILTFNGYPSVVKLGANWSSTIDGFIKLNGRADAGGNVHVVYPVDVTLTHPEPESFSRGDAVALKALVVPRDGALMETASLSSGLGLTADGAFGYHLSGAVSFGINEHPLIGNHKPLESFSNLALFPNELIWNYNPKEERWEQLSRTLANFAPLGVYGYVGYPTVRWRTDRKSSDGSLHADAAETFAYVELDALSFIDTEIPLSFTTDEVEGCQLDYSIVGATATMETKASQQVTFQPRPLVRYEFSEPLLVDGEVCDHVTISAEPLALAGYISPEIIVPSNVGGPVTITPIVILDNEFHNSYGVQSTHALDAEALKYILKTRKLDVIQRWTYLRKWFRDFEWKSYWDQCFRWCWCCDLKGWTPFGSYTICSDCVLCWDWESCLRWKKKWFTRHLGAWFAPWHVKDMEIELGPVITGGYAPTPAPEDSRTESFRLTGFEEMRLDPFLLAPAPWSGGLTFLCSHVVDDPMNEVPIEYSIFGPPTGCEALELEWTDSSDWTPKGIPTVDGDYSEGTHTPDDGSWWFHAAALDTEGNVGELFQYGPIVIDRTPPDISLESDAEWRVQPVEFRVVSNEPLSGVTEALVSVTGGEIVSFELSPEATGILVRVRPDGTGEITLNAATMPDCAGNHSEETDLTVSFVDVIPPELPSLWSPSHPVDVWSRVQEVAIEATATDDVSGVAGYEIAWTQEAEWVPSQAVTDAVSLWSRGIFPAPEDGSWYFHLAVVDGAGNWSGGSTIGPFLIDTMPPEASVTSPHEKWTDVPIEFNIAYSETAPDLDRRYVDVDGGSVVVVRRTSAGSFRVLINPFESGDVTLHDSGCVFDRAGNPSPHASATVKFMDVVLPTPPVLSSPTHEIGVLSNVPDVVIEAHGAADDLSGIAGYEVAWLQDAWLPTHTESAGPLWAGGTYLSQLGEDGNWFLHVMSVDRSGNWSEPLSYGPFVIDTRPPTARITADPEERTTVDEPVQFRIAFSEPVTDFSPEDLELHHASVANWDEESWTDYSFVATPDSSASIVLRVPSAAAEDEAGNPNDPSDWIEVPCSAAPRISEIYLSTSNASGKFVTPGDSVTVAFRIQASGNLDHVDVVIGGCRAAVVPAPAQDGDQILSLRAACVSMSEETAEGILGFQIEALGSGGMAETVEHTTDGHTLIFDRTRPQPIVTSESASHRNEDVTFVIGFGEPVSDLESSSLQVLEGSVSGVARRSEEAFEVTVTPETDQDVLLRVVAGAVLDRAGLESTISETLTVPRAPELDAVSISTSNASSEYCTVGDTVTLTLEASRALSRLPEVEIGGRDADVTYEGSAAYVATCVVGTSTDEGEIEFEVVFKDEAGADGIADETTDGSYVIFDSKTPVIEDCPEDIETTGHVVYWDEPTFWDNGSGIASINQTHHPGDAFPSGITTVTYTAADNAGSVSTCSFDVNVCGDAPTVVLSLAPWETDPTSDWEIDFIAVFSEDVWPSGTAFDVDVDGTTGADHVDVIYTIQMTEWKITVSGMTQSGLLEVTVPAGTVEDADGNPNEESNTVGVQYEHVP